MRVRIPSTSIIIAIATSAQPNVVLCHYFEVLNLHMLWLATLQSSHAGFIIILEHTVIVCLY